MTRLVVDAAMREKLLNSQDFVELCDEGGEVLGVFYQKSSTPPSEDLHSPFTEDEIRRFRKEKGGRSLADILKDLGAS
jgi:hypothetical protein